VPPRLGQREEEWLMNIHDLMATVEWSHPIQLNTKRGVRLLKKAPITQAFWKVYGEDKELFKKQMADAGIQLGKFREEWQLTHWSDDQLKFKQIIVSDNPVEAVAELDLIPLLHPEGLFEYQQTSVQMGVSSMNKYNRVLLGHSTGVGKTFCALGIARELGKRIAVVCPKPITTDWHRAAKMMGVEVFEICGWEWAKTGKSQLGRWTDEHKKTFRFMLPEDVLLVFDEVHRGKGEATQNAFLVRDSVVQNIPAIALSATIADDPTKLWAIGQFLGLHQGGKDYFRFLGQNGCRKTRFGMQFTGGNSVLKKLHSRIYPEKGNRLRHSDLGDAFPETLIKAKAFDMDNAKKIAGEYDDLCNRIEELRMQENFSANVLAEQTRARQRIEMLKAPAVAAMARDLIEEGNSVFIAVNYTETREWLMEELKTDCAIFGGQNEIERRGKIDSFQNDKSRVIIGIIQACREGLNLHDLNGNHSRVALIMPTPSPFDLKQVLGRVHRAGGKSKSIQYIVYAAGVYIEENICEKLDGKLKQMDLLADGECDPTISLLPQEIKELT
jgi:superfamily II DNA or RNA helicase